MRLLHVRELRLEEFLGEEVPPYAVLSHKWGPDEITYQEFLAGAKKDGAGYKKILECCQYAATDIHSMDLLDEYRQSRLSKIKEWGQLILGDWVWVDHLDWVWIDTCCIDKASSTELSEAINSMYRWYAKSRICYVYLSDVVSGVDMDQTMSEFRSSQWFTRGWTLQELLAPKDLMFLDTKWTRIGGRSDLLNHVAEATQIDEDRLESFWSHRIQLISAAEKLSWAARRQTTRTEDGSYALLGNFGINMPLLYGEHRDAFLRLQFELLRSTNDESVFLWQCGRKGRKGLITSWLQKFESKLGFEKGEFSKIEGLARPPYSITNQGLQLQVPAGFSRRTEFLLSLNCQHYEGATLKGAYAIHIEKDVSSGIWRRSGARFGPRHLPDDGTWYRLNGTRISFEGLFVVPTAWVWSREDLVKEGSDIIYAQIK